MTGETCVTLVRTMRQPCTDSNAPRYRCFIICGPDGSVEYDGGSYGVAMMVASQRFPGYPIVQAYKRTAPILGRMGGIEGDADVYRRVSRTDWEV